MNNRTPIILDILQYLARISRRLDDPNTFLHRHFRVGQIIRWVDRRKKSDVDTKRHGIRLAHTPTLADLCPKSLWSGLREGGEKAQAAGVGDGGDEFGFAYPHHAALHEGDAHPEVRGEPGVDRHGDGLDRMT